MKVAIIILPFENGDGLARCVNSVLRQTADDLTIIFTQNESDEAIVNNRLYFDLSYAGRELFFLTEEKKSYEEKLISAIQQVPAEAEYVLFLSHDMALVPDAVELICNQSYQTQILLMKQVFYDGKAFSTDLFADSKDLSGWCLSRELLSDPDVLNLVKREGFSLFKNALLTKQTPIITIPDILIYAAEHPTEHLDTEQRLETIESVCDFLQSPDLNKDAGYNVLYDYGTAYTEVVRDEGMGSQNKQKAFDNLTRIAECIKGNAAYENTFQMITGCSMEEMAGLGHSSYNRFLEQQREQQKRLAERLSGTTNDPGYRNPIDEVPQLFAEGKLGFSVIIKCTKAWFAYKRKK